MKPFMSSRLDGRSDKRVVYELVKDAEPDTLFSYDQLGRELSQGLPDRVSRSRIYRAVTAANRKLLAERQRHLEVVKDQGYRIIRAAEHLPVALARKERGQLQIKRGLDLLRHVRADELTDTERTLHQGQLMILGGFYQALRESDRRHDKTESLIADLTSRVGRLEGQR